MTSTLSTSSAAAPSAAAALAAAASSASSRGQRSVHLWACSSVLVLLLVLLSQGPVTVEARNMPTMNELPMFDGKRSGVMFDPACKGVYDPDLYKQLNKVCDDCFYLYYDETLTAKCRADCFNNDAFKYCTADLLHDVDTYTSYAQRLQSKLG